MCKCLTERRINKVTGIPKQLCIICTSNLSRSRKVMRKVCNIRRVDNSGSNRVWREMNRLSTFMSREEIDSIFKG